MTSTVPTWNTQQPSPMPSDRYRAIWDRVPVPRPRPHLAGATHHHRPRCGFPSICATATRPSPSRWIRSANARSSNC